MIGMSIAAGMPYIGIICILSIYGTAVLTNIRAKIIGEFTLAAFGPTEFKTLLVLFGGVLFLVGMKYSGAGVPLIARALEVLAVLGVLQLVWGLRSAVLEVNRSGTKPDTSEWEQRK